jgi:selenide,water dikinase
MAAFGFVEAERVVRNSTAPVGARLFLTKPIGLGLITTAIKAGRASDAQVRTAIDAMTTLNAAASRAMADAGADAATDVTGFGLLGHLQRMLEASGVAAAVDASAVPLLEGVVELARRGLAPGGTRRNHAFVRRRVDWGTLPEPEQLELADAQTSGGLLIAARDGDALADALSAAGISWSQIGVTTEGAAGTIAVTGRLRSR